MFSTIEAPFWGANGANDGQHPVSGNRQFGFFTNPNGTYTIYTKGADRANRHNFLKPFSFIFDEEKAIYDGGSSCWTSLIDGVSEFLTSQNSDVTILNVKYNEQNFKPKWSTIRELLESSTPISSIQCNE